jgi:hypothetical protein
VGIWLEGRDEAVNGQGHDAEPDESDPALLANALPDQLGASDLGQSGEHKERQ